MKELSNDELSSYLQEINAEEAAELPQDLTGNKAWAPWTTLNSEGVPERGVKTRDELVNQAKKARMSRSEQRAERKKQAREIRQNALSERFIDLNSPLTVEYKKLIIQQEAKKYTEAMLKCEQIINAQFKKYVMCCLPKVVIACWNYYPSVIIPMEPFTYQASEDFGKGFTFRVNIEVPGLFSADELIKTMTARVPQRLIGIDKMIVKFNRLKDAQSKFEIYAANKLLSMRTIYDLLSVNPFWYNDLINKLKEDAAITE